MQIMMQLKLESGRNMVKSMEVLDCRWVYFSQKAVEELEKNKAIITLIKRKLQD